MGAILSAVPEQCGCGGESESGIESEINVEEARTRCIHKGPKKTLRIGVWSAASGDKKFSQTAKNDVAAGFFAGGNGRGHHDIVISPEGSNTATAFENKGYTTVYGAFGIRIFYDAKKLKAEGRPRTITMVGGGGKNRDGSAVGQMLKDQTSKARVIVVEVHAGHYGRSNYLVKGTWPVNDVMRSTAWKAMEELHNLI